MEPPARDGSSSCWPVSTTLGRGGQRCSYEAWLEVCGDEFLADHWTSARLWPVAALIWPSEVALTAGSWACGFWQWFGFLLLFYCCTSRWPEGIRIRGDLLN